MQSILVVVGIAVAVLGAFVLLRFPNRPGGRIAWQGREVSSVGAGLPLIVVGIAAIAIGGAGVGTGDSGDGDRTGAAGGGCKQIFDDVPNTAEPSSSSASTSASSSTQQNRRTDRWR